MFKDYSAGFSVLIAINLLAFFGLNLIISSIPLFMFEKFGVGTLAVIYKTFLLSLSFIPLIGGIVGDRIGYSKALVTGLVLMTIGSLLLTVRLDSDTLGFMGLLSALVLTTVGLGLFQSNVLVMIGLLCDKDRCCKKRDVVFYISYMAINIGSMFAAAAALGIMAWMQKDYGVSKADSYHYAFAVACVSLVLSIIIYYAFRSTFAHADRAKVVAKSATEVVEEELTPAQTKKRIVCLCLLFAVVIFFWMAFHQNGATMTQFAEVYTAKSEGGFMSLFLSESFSFADTRSIWNLVCIIIAVYGLLKIFQSKTAKGKMIAAVLLIASVGVLAYRAMTVTGEVEVKAPIFQQFNPCFVVALTPIIMLMFSSLAKKGKEPSAPMKIGLGMLVAGVGFLLLLVGSMGLLTPDEQSVALKNGTASLVSPNWLISTYFVLTIAELFLSPIGISFVSKVAPPKYKGMMMGGWFVATAIGNFLVAVPALLWGSLPLYVVWGVLIAICLVSAIFIFSILKRLEAVAK